MTLAPSRRTLLAAAAAAPLLSACGAGHTRRSAGSDFAYVAAPRPRAEGSATQADATVHGLSAFTADLYARLSSQSGNLVCSPYSVALALGMVLAGAEGTTSTEIAKALRVAPSTSAWLAGLNAVDQQVRASRRTRVEIASSVWGQRGLTWKKPFLDTLASDFGTGVYAVDCRHDAGSATKAINGWTSDHTGGRITDLIPAGLLDALTRIVLVNAIWLKGTWANPFEKSLTTDRPFTLRDGSTVSVPMMAQDLSEAAYARSSSAGSGWSAVTLPYDGDEVAMTLVVPDSSVAAAERDLAGDGLARLLDSLHTRRARPVDLWLPRWTSRTTASLAPTLAAMGVRTAFTDRADFSAMTADERLSLSAVEHQAYIAVDEHGTEAAAATAAVLGATSATVDQPMTVHADRPFVYVLHHLATRTPLFIGRVDDPRG